MITGTNMQIGGMAHTITNLSDKKMDYAKMIAMRNKEEGALRKAMGRKRARRQQILPRLSSEEQMLLDYPHIKWFEKMHGVTDDWLELVGVARRKGKRKVDPTAAEMEDEESTVKKMIEAKCGHESPMMREFLSKSCLGRRPKFEVTRSF